MATQGYNRYGDNLARKQRRHFFLKLGLALLLVFGVAILVIYGMFFAEFLQVTDVEIVGLKNLKSEEILPIVDSLLSQTVFDPISIKPQKNILFFDEGILIGEILGRHPIVQNVEIKKNYPHKVMIMITERTAMGSWCFIANQECKYFDEEGVFWGKAGQSSGSLFLLINDLRANTDSGKLKKADSLFLGSIKAILSGLDGLAIKVTRVEIPAESIDDIYVYTIKGYHMLFSANSDIKEQIETLKIFLSNQDDNFKPEYIDVRIKGRVYYK